jgi:hypothetical protein
VKARLRRQERLTASDPLHLSALISEAALTRCARQPSVAAEQFRQLLAWAQRPNVEIQVLPFETGLHSGMQGAFTLLSFPESVLPRHRVVGVRAGWPHHRRPVRRGLAG